MKVNQMFPSRWLKAADLDGPVVVTIRKWEMVTLRTDDGDEEKPAVFFEETEKSLVLNITNTNMIAAILKSDESDDWHGRQIGLRSEMVPFKGKPVPSIRVFDPTPPKTGGFGRPKPTPDVAGIPDDVPTAWPSDAMPAAEATLDAGGEPLFDESSIPDPGMPISAKQKKRA